MLNLADALAELASQSDHLHRLSAANSRPAGPFTTAYLYLDSNTDVLSLIRESLESERRLFKFVGETDPTGLGGGNKRVEKQEGGVVTPLRELKQRTRQPGADEVDVVLRTALKLIDDYRPMPRARARVTALLEAHQRNLQRSSELDEAIANVADPRHEAARRHSPALPPSPTAAEKPKLGADDAIKAEEEALRSLEAQIAPLRRSAAASPPTPARPALSLALQQSPPAASSSRHTAIPQTPARTMPHVTNSLVHGTTPHRSVARPSRFSPLKFMGTPRAGPSAQRPLAMVEREEHRHIFGKAPRPTATPAKRADFLDDGDDTVRIASTFSAKAVAAEPQHAPEPTLQKNDLPSSDTPTEPSRHVEGVDLALPTIQPAIDKITSTMADLITAGLGTDQVVTASSAAPDIVRQLHRVSQADPSASISIDHIVHAYLFLTMLRQARAGDEVSEQPGMAMSDAKEQLASMVRARGWESSGELGTKMIYSAVGKKTVRIDRKAAGGGALGFAV